MMSGFKWLMTHPAVKHKRVKAFGKWIWWQTRQRITSKPYVLDWLGGTRLEIVPHGGLTGYLYVGLPDYEELLFLQRALRQNDLFLDIGANAGAYSVLAAAKNCQVHAFEPIPNTYLRLVRNFSLNEGFGKLAAHPKAVGAERGTLRLTTEFDTGNRVVAAGMTDPAIEVETTTLDDVLDQVAGAGIEHIFAKVDVEGYELEVLKGATTFLNSPKVKLLLLETFRPHNFQTPILREIEERLLKEGFLPFEFLPERNELRQLTELNDGGNNTLYIRDVDFVMKRLGTDV